MTERNAESFRNCLAARRALVSIALVATVGIAATSIAGGGATEKPASRAADFRLPKEKQTSLGLYVTAKQAYSKWRESPDAVKVLDVRTPENKRNEFLNVLLRLKGPTEALAECRACWICQDVDNDLALIYLVQWDTEEDLEAHLRSERFRRLLPYIDMSMEPPAVSFGSIERVRGIEFLVEVLSAKTP